MATLMLVSNPTRKTKGKKQMATRRRKPRTAAQKRATAKLVAANRARRAAPVRRRRARRTSVATRARRTYKRASSAARRYVRRTRRSQASLARGGFGVVNLLKQSGVGAVGAIALDIVYSKLPIPDTMKVGYQGAAVKAAATIGLGILAGKVLSKPMAHGATVGALTVQIHELLKGLASGAGLMGVTDINMGYYSPAQIAQSGVGMYLPSPMNSGMGEYVSGYNYEKVY